jgi:hypothetical protein
MSQFTSGNAPGFQPYVEGEDSQVWWSGRGGQTLIATRRITLDKSNTDSGNSPTSTLAGGNILAIEDASGHAYLYDPDANDGRQVAMGVLEKPQDMLFEGVAADRYTQMLVSGLLKEDELAGCDARARAQLADRFVFDQHIGGVGQMLHPRGVYRKSANYTLTAADNGMLFIATDAVTFTLPTKENGLTFRFVQTADANLAISGSADIVHKHNAAANSVTFATASQRIGSHALVECVYTANGTLKWIVSNLGGTTATVA